MRCLPTLSTMGLLVAAMGCRDDPAVLPWKVDLAEIGDAGAGQDTAPPDDSGPGDDTSAGDTDEEEVVVDIPPPELDAAGVASAIQETLAGGLPNPMRTREVYLSMFAGRDDRCPGGGQPSLPGRFEGCWSESGWFYAGYAEYAGSEDPAVTEEPFTLLADGHMIDGDGGVFVAAGELAYDAEPSSSRWEGSLTGTWSYDLADDWMGGDAAGGVLTFEASASAGDWRLEVDGSVAGGAHPIVLHDVTVASDDCGAATTGSVRLRGAEGYWYTLSLDDCGCGPVSYDDGSILGEACVALAEAARPLAQWRL